MAKAIRQPNLEPSNLKLKIRTPKQFKTPFNDMGRECTACGEFKIWEDFPLHLRSTTKRASKCKFCKKQDRPARGIKREVYCAKKHLQALKESDPIEMKARLVRGSLLSRARKNPDLKRDTPTKEEIKSWLEKQKPFKCYYSGVDIKVFDAVLDHKQPVQLGGRNTLDNLCITNKKHNTSKGWLTEKEYKDLLHLISTWEDRGEGLLKRLRQGFY